MNPSRRQGDRGEPLGVTAVVLVDGRSAETGATLARACREELRESDAVLERRRSGVIAVLLRHVRGGREAAQAVAERLRSAGEAALGAPPRVALAVADHDGEALDRLLHRAEAELAANADSSA